MLRFPNPGSDIDSFIRIYQELFEALQEQTMFDLDDMSRVLIERNLVTSSGYMGEEALRRSYNEDRSRDRLYNQSKMYSELYKVLGWLHPTKQSALRFQFTYLGAHVVSAKRDPAAIFRESLLGIAYPTQVLGVKGGHILRPFATILRTMAELDGLLCRDEMIIGPLSLEDDTDSTKFEAMVDELVSIRGNWSSLQAKIEHVSTKRKISPTTMENYTRFPLAALTWTGWAIRERRNEYGRLIPFFVLTNEGYRAHNKVVSSQDIRAANLLAMDEETKAATIRISFYEMLDRAGFNTSTLHEQMKFDLVQATPFLEGSTIPILFSPFQELDPEYINPMFPKISGKKEAMPSQLKLPSVNTIIPPLSSVVSLIPSRENTEKQATNDIAMLFTSTIKIVGNNLNHIVDYIVNKYSSSNKGEFYPFIARLFSSLGYNCEYSRPGVNSQRWDAIIIDPQHSIPIEIKSPGEEEYLSLKAVRQALENKVILLSRGGYSTDQETTSLVVGYKLPNDRSEVTALINNIHKAFNIVIGVIDLRSLLLLVVATVLQGKSHNAEELRYLHGIIRVADT